MFNISNYYDNLRSFNTSVISDYYNALPSVNTTFFTEKLAEAKPYYDEAINSKTATIAIQFFNDNLKNNSIFNGALILLASSSIGKFVAKTQSGDLSLRAIASAALASGAFYAVYLNGAQTKEEVYLNMGFAAVGALYGAATYSSKRDISTEA